MEKSSQHNLNLLPTGTLLGDFRITGVVGEGGFGIVYLAHEVALDRTVAIKEYLPAAIAGRTGNLSVQVRSDGNANAFTSGLKNFLREAQMLARFSHPAMVEVHRVWEQNGTAYMAMRYYAGHTLRTLRQDASAFDETRIRRMLEPVFDALTLLHAQNIIHRDVSPDNILMCDKGTPVLLDLGAARQVIGGMTQALTTVLKPGYAPIEQYVDDGTMKQGPWTDVYGLGAVLYYLTIGSAPPQAVARMLSDPLSTLIGRTATSVPSRVVDAVVKALAVRPEDRFQSVDALREALGWSEPLGSEGRTMLFPDSGAAVKSAPTATRLRQGKADEPVDAPSPSLSTDAHSVFDPSHGAPSSTDSAAVSDTTVVWRRSSTMAPPTTEQPIVSPESTSTHVHTPSGFALDAAMASHVSHVAETLTRPSGSTYTPPKTSTVRWIVMGLVVVLVATAGFFLSNRSDDDARISANQAANQAANSSLPEKTVVEPTITAAPPETQIVSKPAALTPAIAPQASTSPAADTQRIRATPEPAGKSESAKKAASDNAIAKVEADQLLKSRAEAAEKAVQARAAAALQAEQEERARVARKEEEDRIAAEKARQAAAAAAEAEKARADSLPPVQKIDDISAQAMSAYRRGELSIARGLWTEITNHSQASRRSKAVAYNNIAVSYCQNRDEQNCEKTYISMMRADPSYVIDASEREHPFHKRAFERARRAVGGSSGY